METKKDTRLNIKVPAQVHHKAKEAAAKRGLFLWQWIEEKAEQDLSESRYLESFKPNPEYMEAAMAAYERTLKRLAKQENTRKLNEETTSKKTK